MAWSKLVDMELSDEEKLDFVAPIPMATKPDYPCGLRICLTEKELEKLGLDADCEVGDVIDMRAFAEVTSVHKDDKGCCRIELQIQKLSIENESTETDEEEAAEGAGEGNEPEVARRARLAYGGLKYKVR